MGAKTNWIKEEGLFAQRNRFSIIAPFPSLDLLSFVPNSKRCDRERVGVRGRESKISSPERVMDRGTHTHAQKQRLALFSPSGGIVLVCFVLLLTFSSTTRTTLRDRVKKKTCRGGSVHVIRRYTQILNFFVCFSFSQDWRLTFQGHGRKD